MHRLLYNVVGAGYCHRSRAVCSKQRCHRKRAICTEYLPFFVMEAPRTSRRPCQPREGGWEGGLGKGEGIGRRQ